MAAVDCNPYLVRAGFHVSQWLGKPTNYWWNGRSGFSGDSVPPLIGELP